MRKGPELGGKSSRRAKYYSIHTGVEMYTWIKMKIKRILVIMKRKRGSLFCMPQERNPRNKWALCMQPAMDLCVADRVSGLGIENLHVEKRWAVGPPVASSGRGVCRGVDVYKWLG